MKEFLGQKITDNTTGYRGTCTGYAEYVDREPQLLVEAIDSTGRPIESWLPLKRCHIETTGTRRIYNG